MPAPCRAVCHPAGTVIVKAAGGSGAARGHSLRAPPGGPGAAAPAGQGHPGQDARAHDGQGADQRPAARGARAGASPRVRRPARAAAPGRGRHDGRPAVRPARGPGRRGPAAGGRRPVGRPARAATPGGPAGPGPGGGRPAGLRCPGCFPTAHRRARGRSPAHGSSGHGLRPRLPDRGPSGHGSSGPRCHPAAGARARRRRSAGAWACGPAARSSGAVSSGRPRPAPGGLPARLRRLASRRAVPVPAAASRRATVAASGRACGFRCSRASMTGRSGPA